MVRRCEPPPAGVLLDPRPDVQLDRLERGGAELVGDGAEVRVHRPDLPVDLDPLLGVLEDDQEPPLLLRQRLESAREGR